MEHHSDFAALAAFAAIVETGSFRRAAAQLNLKPSTVSHSLRTLEEKLGVRLLNRTTRSVAPTEAGQMLFARLAPALTEIAGALEAVNAFRGRPAGRVRLSVPRGVAAQVLLPRLYDFAARYPEIMLEIAADNGFVDIVRDGFDAGIRLGESVDHDMVAVRVTPPLEAVIVAAPDYLARHPAPQSPQDLAQHRCIGFRQRGGGTLYRWEFQRGGKAFDASVACALVFDDPELMLAAAANGLGLAYGMDVFCRAALDSGALVRVLTDWLPRHDGFYLYYPHRRISVALRALADVLKAK